MSFAILAGDRAGYAISYGLAKEPRWSRHSGACSSGRNSGTAKPGTNGLLALMFALFIVGLGLIVKANTKSETSTCLERIEVIIACPFAIWLM